jgi:quinol monooxygenase YgiN
MPQALTVCARLIAKSGQEANLALALDEVASKSMASGLCSRFDVLLDQSNPSCFALVETFFSGDHFREHMGTDHIEEFLKLVPDYVDSTESFFLEASDFSV